MLRRLGAGADARTQRKTLDTVTVFHKAGSPASTRVANLLKQLSANAGSAATSDQASDHGGPAREPFELNISEDPPTSDQVRTILEYVGAAGASRVVMDARNPDDALERFRKNKDSFLRPLVRARASSCRVVPADACSRRWTGTRARPFLATTSPRFSGFSRRRSDA